MSHTPSHQTQGDPTNPDLDVMRGLASQMREFQPFASDPELGADVRRYLRLVQAKYFEEVGRVAKSRLDASRAERREISGGSLGAAFIGATEAGTAMAGAMAGAAGARAIAGMKAGVKVGARTPGGLVGKGVGIALGGFVGGLAGWMAGKPLIKAAGAATQEQLDATLEDDVNQYIELGAGLGASLLGGGGAAMRTKMAANRANARLVRANATQAEANAEVAGSIAKSKAEQEAAKAAIAKLELADMERRMAHPERAAASTAKFRSIQAESIEKIAKAKTAEWESVITEAKAIGQMNPRDKLRMEIMGRQLVKADIGIKLAEQSLQAGLLKPALAQKMLERITRQIQVLENSAVRGGAQAGVAGEEFATRLALLKNELIIIEAKMIEQGLTPAVAPSSSLVARLGRQLPP